MSAPTISASIVLDSIDLIRENAQRVIADLEAYDAQLVTRTKILRSEGNDAQLDRFSGIQIRNTKKLDQAKQLRQWTADAFDDFASGRVSAKVTISNTMLAGEMLRLIDPAAGQEQGA